MNSAARSQPRRPYPLSRAIVTTSLGFAMVQLDVSIVNVALADIGRALAAGIEKLQWVVDAYTLSFSALLLSAGALGDRAGMRKMFLLGLMLFSFASLACGVAKDIALLIAARAVQGAGAALIMPASLSLLSHACKRDRGARSHAVGWWAAAGGGAMAAGPTLGGLIVNYLSWPAIFLINLPVGLAGVWLTVRFIDETPIGAPGGFDAAGQMLAVLTGFVATWAFIKAGPLGMLAPDVLAGFALALMLGLLFVLRERAASEPMLDLTLFHSRAFNVIILASASVNLALYGQLFILSFFFQKARHYSPATTGLAFLPFMLPIPLLNLFAGRFAAEFGPKRTVLIGLALITAGCVLMLKVDETTAYLPLCGLLALISSGAAICLPQMITAVFTSVPKKSAGVATGAFNAARQMGSALGVAVFGALVANGIVDGMRAAFAASAVILALTAMGIAYFFP